MATFEELRQTFDEDEMQWREELRMIFQQHLGKDAMIVKKIDKYYIHARTYNLLQKSRLQKE